MVVFSSQPLVLRDAAAGTRAKLLGVLPAIQKVDDYYASSNGTGNGVQLATAWNGIRNVIILNYSSQWLGHF